MLESLSNNIATLLKRDSGAGYFRTSYWQMLYKIDILKNSQNSQESTCVRVSFLIKCHVSNLQFFGDGTPFITTRQTSDTSSDNEQKQVTTMVKRVTTIDNE